MASKGRPFPRHPNKPEGTFAGPLTHLLSPPPRTLVQPVTFLLAMARVACLL